MPCLLCYLAGYTLTNIAAFAVTAALPDRRDLTSYRGLASAHPWLAGSLAVALLGLVGTPPTAVFIGKLTTATAAWDGDLAWLAIVVVANSLASLFYYLRWIIPVYRIGAAGNDTISVRFTPSPWSTRVAITAAAASILLGLAAGIVWPVTDGTLIP